MKKLANYLKADLWQLVKGPSWIIGMIGVAVSLFFSLETQGFFNHNIVSTYVYATRMTGSLIAYTFCAFPYAVRISEELENKYARYSVIRGNLKAYVISKAVMIWLSSAVVMIGGTLLFLLLCHSRLPWMDWEMGSDYAALLGGCYGEFLRSGKPLCYCLLYAMDMGLLAGPLSLFAAFCSIYISNRVLVLVMPVIGFRLLASVNLRGYNVYIFYALKVLGEDWQNLLLLIFLSAVVSVLLTAGIYRGMKRKL